MPLTIIQCPDCDAKLKAKAPSAPRKVRCPKCGSIFQVGVDEEALPELDAAEEKAPPRKTMARSGRRRQDDDDNDQQKSPRKSRRRQDDDDQEEPQSRRRQAEDEEDGEDDEVPRRGATVQLWLGVGSLSLAGLVLLAVWIPAFSSLALPLSGVALALGLLGLAMAIIKGVGHGFPIAGCEVSGIALVVSVLWILIIPEVIKGVNDAARAQAGQMQNRRRAADFPGQGQDPLGKGDPQDGLAEPLRGAPTPPTGTLTLAGGSAQLNGQLAATDPVDRALEDSPCKVYTLSMTAGRTYQIDMTSAQFDAYLRLEDPEGRNLVENDDGGGDLNARIVFTCRRDGRYRIVTTALEGIGSFTLRVQEK